MSLRKHGSSPSSSLSLPKLLPHLHNSTVWAANFAMKPSFDISLDGIVLKLHSRSSVIAVVNRSSTIGEREGLAQAA
jgi:hypothetical protein